MTAVVLQDINKRVINNRPEVNNTRHYRRDPDWQAIYAQIMTEDGQITAYSLVERELVKTKAAAWKLMERHRKAGIIRRYAWPGIHDLITMSGTQAYGDHYLANKAFNESLAHRMSTKKGDSTLSVQSKEHSYRNTTTSAERVRKHRRLAKLRDRCRCYRRYGDTVYCDRCVDRLFSGDLLSARDEIRIDAIHYPRPVDPCVVYRVPPNRVYNRSMLYGELGRRVGPFGQFYSVIDKITEIKSKVHKTYFEILDAQPDDRELSAYGQGRNRAIRQDVVVNGVSVHVERYKCGKILIKPRLTKTPLAPEDLPAFMTAIKQALKTQVPISEWRISATDLNRDIPIATGDLKGFKLPPFEYNRHTIQAYVKDIQGQRYLRVEAQLYPGVTLAGYYDVLAKAERILMEVCGK